MTNEAYQYYTEKDTQQLEFRVNRKDSNMEMRFGKAVTTDKLYELVELVGNGAFQSRFVQKGEFAAQRRAQALHPDIQAWQEREDGSLRTSFYDPKMRQRRHFVLREVN